MVRGCEKKVVFLKNTGSEFFEEAYFVLCASFESQGGDDMIAEANRIISEMEGGDGNRGKRKLFSRGNIASFSFGFLISALFSTVITLIVVL